MVDATIKGAKGQTSSARTEQPLRSNVSHIRVIGREERTNAEQAQYRLLLGSLTAARSPPLFVNIIWFPRNAKEIKGDGELNLLCQQSSQIPKDLNDSQKGIVRAVLSMTPQDSLVIAHGIYIFLQRPFMTPMPMRLHRASRNRENDHHCRSSRDMGIL